MTSSIEHLTEYGTQLVADGLEVWITRTGSRPGAYLQYRDPATGACGSLQYSEHDATGWQHLMPIVPSRAHGSSMFLGEPVENPWTVEAARQCAQPFNHNRLVGRQANAGDRTWRSPDALALHSA